ncbi:MAG: dephospho-CoA kinase [Tannerella sp.]|jgi:dephospho-CoA kinase|nr:dephospho-CoA kinase [Tannerella sp.]
MTTIGLTGGIGSGKSVVASLLELYGIPVYKADDESKHLLNSSPQIREQLMALLGRDVYDDAGVNRRKMAALIFNDTKLLEQANAIIHPQVNRHFRSWAESRTTEFVVLESAILFESNFNRLVNICLLVYAPQDLRIRRVMARDGITEAEVLQRIQHQMPDEEKMKYADYVIVNDDINPLIPQVEKWITNDLRTINL